MEILYFTPNRKNPVRLAKVDTLSAAGALACPRTSPDFGKFLWKSPSDFPGPAEVGNLHHVRTAEITVKPKTNVPHPVNCSAALKNFRTANSAETMAEMDTAKISIYPTTT
jgi:hypothetical protein